jgi:hypothetical protein
MHIRFRCTQCQTPLETDPQSAGTEAVCPRCHTTLIVPRPDIGPGATLGGFRVERLIGEGGMGQVYLARQLSMDRDVALKVLRGGEDWSDDAAERFLHEVRLLARLDHPHIVTAHEAGEEAGVLYLAMGLVRGDPVDRRIARDGAIPEGEALRIARKIADALDYAWTDHRLLHRDLKPSNILMDPHGEPKLADLGLAQSLLHEGHRPDEIAGTPNYMSPEQAAGSDTLDCRSDIYSMGATLYHMVTGKLPFDAASPEETLRLKKTSTLPDPRTFHPEISAHFVALLSGMLCANPGDRYGTWAEVREDMDRVLRGHAPRRGGGAEPDPSKIRISAAQAEHIRAPHPVRRNRRSWVYPAVGIAVAVPALIAGVLIFRDLQPEIPSGVTIHPVQPGRPPDPDRPGPDAAALEAMRQVQAREEALRPKVDELLARGAEHPADFDPMIEHWRALVPEAQGTSFERRVNEQLRQWTEARAAARAGVLTTLTEQAQALVVEGEFEAAALRMEQYAGPFAGETADERTRAAADIRAQAVQVMERQQAEAQQVWTRARRQMAERVLQNDPAGAGAVLAEACRDAGLDASEGEPAAWKALIDRIVSFDAWLLKTFQSDTGRTFELVTPQRRETWTITGVTDQGVRLRRDLGGAVTERMLRASEIGLDERVQRVAREAPPLRTQLTAWLAMLAGRPDAVGAILRATEDDPVGRAMADAAEALQQQAVEDAAQRALAALLRRAGVTAADEEPERMAARIRRTSYALAEADQIRIMTADARRRFGEMDPFVRMAPVLRALENVAPWPREIDPAAIDAALRQLASQNPGFHPHEAKWSANDDGVHMAIQALAVSNVRALEALPLTRVDLSSTSVRDISPLRSMPLTHLHVSGTSVRDFSSLRSTPLRELIAENTGMTQLSSLRGLSLESITISTNQVQSLLPLTGMPIKRFVARHCPLGPLAALSRMPIEYLDLSGVPGGIDLRPLRSAPLKTALLSGSGVQDLSGLRGTPLEELHLDWCSSPALLASLPDGLPLRHLSFRGLRSPEIAAMPKLPRLDVLNLADSRLLVNIRGLGGLPLKELNLSRTRVRDLTPLRGMPLERLHLAGSEVRDLSPLEGSPLTYLDLSGALSIRDLSPLMQCPKLETLILPQVGFTIDDLEAHPALRKVGTHPNRLMSPEDFAQQNRWQAPVER